MNLQESIQKIKYEIRDGCLWEGSRVVAVFTDEATTHDETLIKLGAEVVPEVQEFIDNVNSGNYKPRAAVKRLETILNKYA